MLLARVLGQAGNVLLGHGHGERERAPLNPSSVKQFSQDASPALFLIEAIHDRLLSGTAQPRR